MFPRLTSYYLYNRFCGLHFTIFVRIHSSKTDIIAAKIDTTSRYPNITFPFFLINWMDHNHSQIVIHKIPTIWHKHEIKMNHLIHNWDHLEHLKSSAFFHSSPWMSGCFIRNEYDFTAQKMNVILSPFRIQNNEYNVTTVILLSFPPIKILRSLQFGDEIRILHYLSSTSKDSSFFRTSGRAEHSAFKFDAFNLDGWW